MEQEFRPLTREEQLEWYVPFLEEQIKMYMEELERAKAELSQIKGSQRKR